MLLNIAFLLGGIVLLYFGAEGLVGGSSSLARRLKLTPLVIGLTVVAFGTSMPEMVVSVGAALSGSAPIAAGNVVGSNIANIALILGASAIICPLAVHVRVIRLDLPLLLIVSFATAAVLLDQTVGRFEGTLLVAGLIGYTVFSLRAARKETADAVHVFEDAIPKDGRSVPASVAFVVGGLVLL
ncbi:MAG: sodium:calcium antiporter, partial [Phycisphaeraceae bacterium]